MTGRSSKSLCRKACVCGVLMLATASAGLAAETATRRGVQGVVVEGSRVVDPERDGDPVINNLERRTFRYFWETANTRNGMIPDRFPSPSFASIAAVGFGLT